MELYFYVATIWHHATAVAVYIQVLINSTHKLYWQTLMINITCDRFLFSVQWTRMLIRRYDVTLLTNFTDKLYWQTLLTNITDKHYWQTLLANFTLLTNFTHKLYSMTQSTGKSLYMETIWWLIPRESPCGMTSSISGFPRMSRYHNFPRMPRYMWI